MQELLKNLKQNEKLIPNTPNKIDWMTQYANKSRQKLKSDLDELLNLTTQDIENFNKTPTVYQDQVNECIKYLENRIREPDNNA